jgi:hypothetical protein
MGEEIRVLEKLAEMIKDIKYGLDPDVLADWYKVIETEAKSLCPDELRDSIAVTRDPILTLKFEFKASKRAIPCVIEAIENNLSAMPFATRLYFQKLEEIVQQEAGILR